MQAIVTKYSPATASGRGSRIIAKCQAGRVSVPFHYGATDPHDVAAAQLIAKLGWQDNGTWTRGGAPDGTGNVYVCAPEKYSEALDLNAATAPERE